MASQQCVSEGDRQSTTNRSNFNDSNGRSDSNNGSCSVGSSRSMRSLLSGRRRPTAAAAALVTAAASLIVAVGCAPTASAQPQLPVVKTDKGSVRGTRHSLLDGLVVNEFLGIPYARPPVGGLRFRKPLEAIPWDGVYNATSRPNACWQPVDEVFGDFAGSTMWNPNTERSEDCLYLNVWSPAVAGSAAGIVSGRRLPVMVWIYGGGFYSGSSSLDLYDGKYVAAVGEVVLVSMNYRVGMLGFLALRGRDDAPGNMGLHDQLLALRWVQANVAAFGGDPDSVTLFGESAGSVSVSLHLLSPLSRDLFHRAVLQSGVALSEWSLMTADNAERRYSAVLFPKLGCAYSSGAAGAELNGVMECLRSQNASYIMENEYFTSDLAQFPFVPIVDNDFLVESPRASMESGNFKRCPIVIGSNGNEGTYFLTYMPLFATSFNTTEVDFAIGQAKFREIMQQAFASYPQWPQQLTSFALDAIVYRYTDWLSPDDTHRNLNGLDGAVGDYHFLCPVNEWAAQYARYGLPVYYYHYTHVSSLKHWGRWTGAMHADELNYVFGEPLRPDQPFTDDEKLFSRHIVELWTNFAKTGNPTRYANGSSMQHRWPLHETPSRKYYELSIPSLKTRHGMTGVGPRVEYCAFWSKYMPGLVTSTDRLAHSGCRRGSFRTPQPDRANSQVSLAASAGTAPRLAAAIAAAAALAAASYASADLARTAAS